MASYDNGFLDAWVVVKKDESTGEIWELRAKKDFKDEGKIKWPDATRQQSSAKIRLARIGR